LMNSKILKILLVEDNPGDARLIEEMLKESDIQFTLDCAGSLAAGIGLINSNNFDVILLDLGLPDCKGLDTFFKFHENKSHAAAGVDATAIIVLTGLADDTTGLEAVKSGAQDYLIKGQINAILLVRAIQYAIERKKVEMALQISEERYRVLVEWLPEAIGIHRDGKLIYVNPAAVKILGAKSAKDLIGTPILDFVHPDYHQIVLERMANTTNVGIVAPVIEEKFLILDGTVIDVEVKNTSIIYDGKPAYYIAIHDITERKQAEDEICKLNAELEQRILERTAELEKKNKELQTMIDGFIDQELRLIEVKEQMAKFKKENCMPE